MFHVLYYVPADERQEFLKKVHGSWLASGGYVALMTASRTKSPNSASIIIERLGSPIPAWEEIEADFLKAGFKKYYEHEIHRRRDLASPDENLLPFYQPYFKKGPITLVDLRDATKGLLVDGKVDSFFMMAIFIKRTN